MKIKNRLDQNHRTSDRTKSTNKNTTSNGTKMHKKEPDLVNAIFLKYSFILAFKVSMQTADEMYHNFGPTTVKARSRLDFKLDECKFIRGSWAPWRSIRGR